MEQLQRGGSYIVLLKKSYFSPHYSFFLLPFLRGVTCMYAAIIIDCPASPLFYLRDRPLGRPAAYLPRKKKKTTR